MTKCEKCEEDYPVVYEITIIVEINEEECRGSTYRYCKYCLLDAAKWQVGIND